MKSGHLQHDRMPGHRLRPEYSRGIYSLPDVANPVALSPRARSLHFSSLVIDTHVDTTQRLLDPRFDLAHRHPDGSVDIPRLREGGVGAIFFAVWTPGTVTGPAAVKRALDQIEAVRRQIDLHPDDLALATTAQDIREARASGRIAILLGIEGGHLINSDLTVLARFHSLGARYMTLTHILNVEWADSSTDKPAHNGLTDFGRLVIREMNRVGMMVDISHVSDKTFQDALAISAAPLIATHSCCRALCDAPRNLSDEMIRQLAAKGGLVQINFHAGFLSQPFRSAMKADPRIDEEIDRRIEELCGEDHACRLLEADKMIRDLVAQGKLPRVEWTEILDHIDHAVKLVGADHVGLGSDFDGADMPYGMDDASHLPRITEALLEKGYSESDIQKILGGNLLRLMQDVEAIASKLEGTP
jgi:membrane dipeptidase